MAPDSITSWLLVGIGVINSGLLIWTLRTQSQATSSQVELTRSQLRIDRERIRPAFNIQSKYNEEQYLMMVYVSILNNYAYNVEFLLNNNNFNFQSKNAETRNARFLNKPFISKNTSFGLFSTYSLDIYEYQQEDLDIQDLNLDLTIRFDDEEGNRYTQTFRGKYSGNMRFSITPPALIN